MKEAETKFNKALCIRTKAIRNKISLSQEKMSEKLDVSFYAYQKYEIRSPIKHYLIPKFCKITGISPQYLLTGKDSD